MMVICNKQFRILELWYVRQTRNQSKASKPSNTAATDATSILCPPTIVVAELPPLPDPPEPVVLDPEPDDDEELPLINKKSRG